MTHTSTGFSAQVFPAGARVFDASDPDRQGKIVGAGAEVSQVHFDDGADRNIPNVFWLDSPTDNAEPEITAGQQAWARLRNHSTWQDWKAVGAAHVVGRTTAIRDAHSNKPEGRGYNAAFAAWAKKFGFSDLDKGDRSRLFQVMDRLGEIEAWLAKLPLTKRLSLNHPTSVLRNWKAATAEKNPEPKTSPVQKLKESVVALQEENDRMKREIERGGGDLWTAEDRPKDIAGVVVAKLGKSKATKVAQAILATVKEVTK